MAGKKNRTVLADSSGWRKLTKLQINIKLLMACTFRDADAVKLAIRNGANVNCRRTDFMTPLHIAAEHDDVEIVQQLCATPGINLEAKTMHGLTPMHTAALLGHVKVIKKLASFGSRISCKDNLERRPLHYAAFHRDTECARYLIKFGAQIHVYDVFQETPLAISVLKTKNMPMIKLLSSYKSKQSSFTPYDAQCLLLEAILGAREPYDIEIIDLILHYSGDVINVPDLIGGRTPLHVVAMTGYYQLAEYLVNHGADLTAKNRANQTPMQVAMNYKNLPIARMLQDRSVSAGISEEVSRE